MFSIPLSILSVWKYTVASVIRLVWNRVSRTRSCHGMSCLLSFFSPLPILWRPRSHIECQPFARTCHFGLICLTVAIDVCATRLPFQEGCHTSTCIPLTSLIVIYFAVLSGVIFS